jgi:DNA replication protein DnaC
VVHGPKPTLYLSVLYARLSRLLDDLAVARLGNGVGRLMRQVSRVSVLILDDWAMIDPTAAQRRDLMEVIDDRHDRGSIILASQLPVDRWHATIGDPTYADAILDRLVHNAIRLPLRANRCASRRPMPTATQRVTPQANNRLLNRSFLLEICLTD